MRTAMQELIMFCGDSKELSQVKQYAEIQLQKEKQQIVDAYDSGWSDSAENQTAMCNSKKYYNETFNQ